MHYMQLKIQANSGMSFEHPTHHQHKDCLHLDLMCVHSHSDQCTASEIRLPSPQTPSFPSSPDPHQSNQSREPWGCRACALACVRAAQLQECLHQKRTECLRRR